MKNTMKIFLVIALFCSTSFAEGDMGNGGLWSGDETTNSLEGDMGNGGKTCPQGQTCLVGSNDSDDSILKSIKDYLASIIG
ncbi:MAG: hypothetical protein H7070_06160 [Saprospiraceae bacterium]|nr:hypothetical protein [Pyrinomonadaceae bacterium]